MDIGKFFISQNGEPIEGYLSDNHQPKILIILKEPHTDDNLIFWFYRVVNNMEDFKEKSARTGTGKRFFNIIGNIACALLKYEKNDAAAKETALKQCAFINLYPYDGKAYAGKSSGYQSTLRALKGKADGRTAELTELVERRRELFRNLGESSIECVLTVPEVYELLTHGKTDEYSFYLNLAYGKGKLKSFRRSTVDGIAVYEFWHPSCVKISYHHLNKALGFH